MNSETQLNNEIKTQLESAGFDYIQDYRQDRMAVAWLPNGVGVAYRYGVGAVKPDYSLGFTVLDPDGAPLQKCVNLPEAIAAATAILS